MKTRIKYRIIRSAITALAVAGLVLTVSCAQKAVTTSPRTDQAQNQDQPEKIQEEASQAEAVQEEKTVAPDKDAVARAQENEAAARAAEEAFLARHLLFGFDRSDLDETAQALAREKAAWLMANPEVRVLVEGHCDSAGSDAYNMALGARRARAVADYLTSLGVSDRRLSQVSMGETDPVSTEPGKEAARLNRRVQFKIQAPAQ